MPKYKRARESRTRCVWIHIVFNLQFIFIANALNENLLFILFYFIFLIPLS